MMKQKDKLKRDEVRQRDRRLFLIFGILIGVLVAGLGAVGVWLFIADDPQSAPPRVSIVEVGGSQSSDGTLDPASAGAQSIQPTIIAPRLRSAAISPDGQYLAVVAYSEGVGRLQLRRLRVSDNLSSNTLWEVGPRISYDADVQFSPDGRFVAVSSGDASVVTLYDADDGTTFAEYAGHAHAAFSPDARYLALAGYNTDIYIVDMQTNTVVNSWQPQTGKSTIIQSLAFNVSNQLAVVWWDQEQSQLVRYDDVLSPVESTQQMNLPDSAISSVDDMIFHPDGDWLVIAHDASIMAVNTATMTTTPEYKSYNLHVRRISSVAFSDDGQWLAAAGGSSDIGEGLLRAWRWSDADAQAVIPPDPAAFEQITFDGHDHIVTDVAFTADDRLLSASHDGSVRLWNTTDGSQISQMNIQ